jgi:hypothetical protein
MKNVMERLLKVAPRYIAPFGADCCILATKIALEVLEYYKVPAKPLTVRAKINNEAMEQRIVKEGRLPKDTAEITAWGKEDGSYNIGLGYGESKEKWAGHLVVVAEGKLLDLTLGQVYRPEWKIRLEPILVPVTKRFLEGNETLVLHSEGCKVEYKAFPDDQSYTKVPDWTGNIRGVATGIIFNI